MHTNFISIFSLTFLDMRGRGWPRPDFLSCAGNPASGNCIYPDDRRADDRRVNFAEGLG